MYIYDGRQSILQHLRTVCEARGGHAVSKDDIFTRQVLDIPICRKYSGFIAQAVYLSVQNCELYLVERLYGYYSHDMRVIDSNRFVFALMYVDLVLITYHGMLEANED